VEALAPVDTCVAPVLTVPELVEDPQFTARHAFASARHPDHGVFRQVGAVFAGQLEFDVVDVGGADFSSAEEILGLAGLSADETSVALAQGAVA
jgi:alpha-methylacyl-CoA racemase